MLEGAQGIEGKDVVVLGVNGGCGDGGCGDGGCGDGGCGDNGCGDGRCGDGGCGVGGLGVRFSGVGGGASQPETIDATTLIDSTAQSSPDVKRVCASMEERKSKLGALLAEVGP